jgi:FKBP-type peptidyl-prolyl cis-trans isomerase (trigger factor)
MVRAAGVLDEVTRRERLEVTAEEIEREVERHAERTGRTSTAMRAALEKQDGQSPAAASLGRERSIDFVSAHARVVD